MSSDMMERWSSLSQNVRATVLSVVLMAVLLVVGSVWLFQSKDFVPLYEGLSAESSATLLAKLTEQKVDYQIEDGGKTILVDKNAEQAIRAKLASTTMVATGVDGFEIFENLEYGGNDFSQKVFYLRALQGEIARTIVALESVKAARVHLVLPEQTLFERAAPEPKAAVTIVPEDGYALHKTELKGIQSIVASAVKGLAASKVVITDQQGKVLVDGLEDPGQFHMDGKRAIESYLAMKAQNLVNEVYGVGMAHVEVDVTLAMAVRQSQREEVVPGFDGRGVLVDKKESSKEDYADRESGGEDAHRKPAVRSKSVELKYVTGKRSEQVSTREGGIERITAAVVVDPALFAVEDQEAVAKLVGGAIGVDSARGDVVELLSAKFSREEKRKSAPAMQPSAVRKPEVSRTQISPPQGAGGNVAWIVASALIFVGLLGAYSIGRRGAVQRLSPVERERLSAEIRRMLASGNVGGPA